MAHDSAEEDLAGVPEALVEIGFASDACSGKAI
jgi:hypothetical protein